MTLPYFDLPKPRLFGHRGSAATHPENTLISFSAAVESGVPYLELDVWETRDGQIVVHHDETLQRTCGDERRVSDLSLHQLQRVDAGDAFSPDGIGFPFRGRGVKVPTLREVLERFPEVRCNIEIKQENPPIEEQVLKTVRECAADERVLIASEKDTVLTRLRPQCGEIPTNLGYGEVAAFFAWLQQDCPQGYEPPGQALQIPAQWGELRLVTRASLAAAHRLGLEMHVWTVNEETQMKELLAMGVDGLMSDRPRLLAKVAGRFQ